MNTLFEFVCMTYDEASYDAEYFNRYLNSKELDLIKNATNKRKQEFLYGRLCAKLAYLKLCETIDSPIYIRNDRFGAPFFSDGTKFVSITHNCGLSAAIVTDKERLQVGIDVQKTSLHVDALYKFISEREKLIIEDHNSKYKQQVMATANLGSKGVIE